MSTLQIITNSIMGIWAIVSIVVTIKKYKDERRDRKYLLTYTIDTEDEYDEDEDLIEYEREYYNAIFHVKGGRYQSVSQIQEEIASNVRVTKNGRPVKVNKADIIIINTMEL